MKTLAWWWPSPERLHEILLSDAEAHSPAVALAVHQRMQIRRRHHSELIDTPRAEHVDERAILKQLEEVVGDGCQVLLIEGKSGTGKSHVVRWLEIQLDRQEDRASRVVLAVGKGSRLRDIVKRLCDRPELEGDAHADLRQQLSRVQEPIEPRDAASRLCQELASVCEARARAAKRKQQEGRSLTEIEKLQKEWGDTRQLPHILVYNPLRPLFVDEGRAMRRLVEHLHAKVDPLGVRTEQEFVDADLLFDEIPDEIDDNAGRVLSRLGDPDRRRDAIRVLNEALDEAKRSLLHLNPGVLQDVFKSIRQELLRQEKELVLLIEDFADLSGLQKEVLQASIQTGSPGGMKTYCTLRTVFAYTDGILKEETVLSRAQHIYYVPNLLREHDVIEQSVRLIGSYLQAARFGAAALENAMRGGHAAEQWLPAPPDLDDEATAVRDQFGKSSESIPLFPFTRAVIDQLIRDTYSKDLLFIPRDIIRDVMPRVLQHRDAFLRGDFPPDAFRPSRAAQLTEEQSRWLRKVNPTGAMRQRLESFLLYWGLNAGAARAFGLPQPDSADDKEPPSTEAPPPSESHEPPRSRREDASGGESAPAELFPDERQLFQHWRAGTDIASNQERRAIRKAIDVSLRPVLAWAWLPRIEKSSAVSARWNGLHEWIDIAGLRRASDVHVPLTLVTKEERDDKLANEALAKELVGVYAPTKTWDLASIEPHLVAHLSFIESHRAEAERHFLGIWHSRSWDALPFLVTALAMTGAVLGVRDCASSVPADFIDALFADPPPMAPRDGTWSREIAMPLRELRTSLRRLLELEVGAYQGDGGTVQGIDVERLLPFVPAPKRDPGPLPTVPAFPASASMDPDIKTVTTAAAILGRVASASIDELDARRAVATVVRGHLGEHLEKDALVIALGALRKEVSELDALTEERANEVKTMIAALKKAAVVDPLDSTDRLVANDASPFQRLISLGSNEPDAARLENTKSILEKVDEFLREHERYLADATDIDPLDEALAAHETELAGARGVLEELASRTEAAP